MKFPEAPNIADLENGYLSILHSFWKICAFGVAFFDKKECENQAASEAYLIIVADAADAVSVNFSGRCKFLQIWREKLAFSTDFTRKSGIFFTDLTRKTGIFRCKFYYPKFCPCKKNDKYKVCTRTNIHFF